MQTIVAIQAGLFDLVRANIVGSILGQLLLVFGLSLIVGGSRFKEQIFNSKNIRFHITLLLMSIAILSIPTILILGNLTVTETNVENSLNSNSFMIFVLSNFFAISLIMIYILSTSHFMTAFVRFHNEICSSSMKHTRMFAHFKLRTYPKINFL